MFKVAVSRPSEHDCFCAPRQGSVSWAGPVELVGLAELGGKLFGM